MKSHWFKTTALMLGLLLLASFALASTGSIKGTVVDNNDQPLPGVSVEINSPNLQGTRTTQTDVNGNFRFPAIPPGIYSLTAAMDGFADLKQDDVKVGLDRTVTLKVRMQSSFEETVTVTGEAPAIDITTPSLGENYDEEILTSLPMGRSFTSVTRVTPGAQYEDQYTDGYAIYGSTGAENNYIIDGVETTEVERGRTGKQINLEFIQEVEVKTGGYNAEYGRATGGIVNVITKSGGNEFHGDVFTYYHTDDTQDDFDGDGYQDLSSPPSAAAGLTRQDYGFDLGGYILQDQLWFFVAYDMVRYDDTELVSEYVQETYGAPAEVTKDRERDLRALKLTYNINESHNVVFSMFGDPQDITGPYDDIQGERGTYWMTRETGGDDYSLKYLGILTPNLLLNISAAQHMEKDYISPESNEVLVIDRRQDEEYRTGGFGYYFEEDYERLQYKVDLSYFLEAAGSHEFKLGYEQQELEADKMVKFTGGQQVWILPCTASANCEDGQEFYYAHEFSVTSDSTSSTNWAWADGYADVPTTENNSVYLQDSWKVLPNLTLNLGVRWEQQALFDGSGREWISLDDNIAPRFGFVWDPMNDGKSKVYFHYGTYFENIPMDINIRFMGKEVDAFFYNNSLTDLDPDDDLRLGRIRGSDSLLELFEAWGGLAVDPDMNGQSIDEWIVGYEAELIPRWNFGITGIFRELNDVIEDGGVVITNPETGETGYSYIVGNGGENFLGWAPNTNWDDLDGDGEVDVWPVPGPKREYTAIQLKAQKRYSDNWALYASYVWSQLEGNYDGTYQRSTTQLDPNINSAYDYVDFMYVVDPANPYTTKLDGPLSNDREHMFKIDAYYTLDFGLDLGASAYWQSGRPVSAQGWCDAYRNNELWLTQRGALGTMDDEYEMDLHFGYPFKTGPVTIRAFVDIFNVLNRQGVIDVDQLWNFSEGDTVDGSISGCEAYDGMTYDDSIPDFCAPNADFLKGIEWQSPRYFRLGVKISF